MKLKAKQTYGKPVGNILYNTNASDMDMDARCSWILALLGGLLLAGIWFISTFLK